MKTRLKKGLAWTIGAVLLCGIAAGAYVFTHMSQTLPSLALAINLCALPRRTGRDDHDRTQPGRSFRGSTVACRPGACGPRGRLAEL